MPYQELNLPRKNVMSRRKFVDMVWKFLVGTIAFGPLLNTSCSSAPKKTDEKIDLPEGVWDREKVIEIAKSMLREDKENNLNDIGYAGSLLLGNQQGEKTFSRENSIFTDEPVSIEAWDHTGKDYTGQEALFLAITEKSGEDLKILLKSKGKAKDMNISATSRLSLSKIMLNKSELKEVSALGIKFGIAKEIYNLIAIKIVTDKAMQSFESQYVLPTKVEEYDAVRVWSGFQELIYKGYSVNIHFAIDILAHYLLVPNFLLAKEAGKINSADLNIFALLDSSADYFKRLKILSKKDDKYLWTQGPERELGWFDGIVVVQQNMLKKSQENPNTKISYKDVDLYRKIA